MPQDVYNIWRQYERQMAPIAPPVSYGTVVVGIKNGVTIPNYLASYGPFYAGISEIAAFTNALSQLAQSAEQVQDNVTRLYDCLSDMSGLVPNIRYPSFNIADIIQEINFSFSIVDVTSGRCGLEVSLPTTILGAVQNVVHSVARALITNMINFLDKVDTMFASPTRMVNNLMNWLGDTKEDVKGPIQEQRDKLMNKLRELRYEARINNDPTIKIDIINQMNLVGGLDRKARDLTTCFRVLEDSVARFLIHLENCMRLGVALARNFQNIINGIAKGSVCIQTKFNSLIRLYI